MKRRASPGEALRFFNEVVMPYEGDECMTWPFATASGYGKLWLVDRLQTVSRAVCERVHGPAPTPEHEAAHSCGRGRFSCVTKRHLSWKTSIANKADKHIHGTQTRGDKHPQAKLTEAQVRQILELRGVLPQSKIAAMVGVCQSHVCLIQRRKSWTHIELEIA